jgi:alkanesulfonate monooxygenase SsuD/methylene tetrahydromethanopterin reductase-like flavin-dependent oxidoreductase (luciferase family)
VRRSEGQPQARWRCRQIDERSHPIRFSIRLNNDLPLDSYVPLARAAEEAGFDQFWVSHDLFLRSSPVILTACALATERIELGTCILWLHGTSL